MSEDAEVRLGAATGLGRLLSDGDPPIDAVVGTAGCVPRLVELLRCDRHPRLQFLVAVVLSNIASGTTEHAAAVVAHGAIPRFVELLASPDEDVREQVVWALGNIAGDSAEHRDAVLRCNPLPQILQHANSLSSRILMARTAACTLSNLCRWYARETLPPPHRKRMKCTHCRACVPQEYTAPCGNACSLRPDICVAHRGARGRGSSADACLGLSYLSAHSSSGVQARAQCELCVRLG